MAEPIEGGERGREREEGWERKRERERGGREKKGRGGRERDGEERWRERGRGGRGQIINSETSKIFWSHTSLELFALAFRILELMSEMM